MVREPAIRVKARLKMRTECLSCDVAVTWEFLAIKTAKCILIAWLIRHAAWSLTRFQVKNDGRTLFVRVFGKAYTGQVLLFGESVMYKYTAVPTGNLDQRWSHGIWVCKAPMTDEHISLTENGAQKARSLHRVPPEERFVISELQKVRGLPWNGGAENLKATIVTQQDQGPSGHRRVYLTTRVVARHGATPCCSGCVGLGPHTEVCRVRLEKALADERADPVEAIWTDHRACH